jgi:hypothetical protein
MHDKAGIAAIPSKAAPLFLVIAGLSGLKPRVVAAVATPIASNVMTASALFATDFSARNSVTTPITPKKPTAVKVGHIGSAGERHI